MMSDVNVMLPFMCMHVCFL